MWRFDECDCPSCGREYEGDRPEEEYYDTHDCPTCEEPAYLPTKQEDNMLNRPLN